MMDGYVGETQVPNKFLGQTSQADWTSRQALILGSLATLYSANKSDTVLMCSGVHGAFELAFAWIAAILASRIHIFGKTPKRTIRRFDPR